MSVTKAEAPRVDATIAKVPKSSHQVGVRSGFRFELPASHRLSETYKRRLRGLVRRSSDHAVDRALVSPASVAEQVRDERL
jgi:hypothetical protein